MNDDPPRGLGCATKVVAAILFVAAIALALLGRAGCGPCSFPRKVAGQVVDETGQPVPSADVKLEWSEGMGLNWNPSDERRSELKSDANGRFSGRGGIMYFGLNARKEGYYPSRLDVSGEMPSDSLRILLNKIRRPQPMVGKRVKLFLPIGASSLQYDFTAGDCLPPHGKGVVADLEIEWTRLEVMGAEASRRAFKSRINGAGNGVIPPGETSPASPSMSSLRSLHEAPAEGYEPSCDFGNHMRGGSLVAYVRIRTGQPSGPLYGKMLDPISYWAAGDADEFEFEYVINPTGDRGLEMDMKHITVPSKHRLEYAPDEF